MSAIIRSLQRIWDTLADAGASLIGYTPAWTNGNATTASAELDKTVRLSKFTANDGTPAGSGVPAKDTQAWQAALTMLGDTGRPRKLIVDVPTTVNSALSITRNFITIEWETTGATDITKAFNGEIFHISGGEVEFLRPAIDGAGGTYTGGGVRLLAGGANSFKCLFARIKETAAAPIVIEGDGGSLAKIIGGLLQPYGAAAAGPVHAVAMTSADTAPNNRKLIGVSTGGAPILDASGAETFAVADCDGSDVKTSATSKKISMIGNRMQTAGRNMQLHGIDHVVTGNTIASSIELGATAANCTVAGNVTVGPEILSDAAGVASNFYNAASDYTTAWTADTTNPAIGNGTITANYQRTGKTCRAAINLVIGTTTTKGVGQWSFSAPFTASKTAIGAVWALQAGTAYKIGACLVLEGSAQIQAYFDDAPSAASASQPFAWAGGDTLRITVEYPL